jgi:DNA segregation ATPase FtsK/SpoIIIE, S-DNA-T family
MNPSLNPNESIAKVICRILRNKLDHESGKDKTDDALQLLVQGLRPETVVAAVTKIHLDPVLKDKVEIHLARKVFAGSDLPDEVLTDAAAGSFRNEEPEPGRKIVILGPPDDSEWNTVKWMQPFGEQEIMEADQAWVDEFAPPLTGDNDKTAWRAALRGLTSLAFTKLNEFAGFVSMTSEFCSQGKLLETALGLSLPALRLPRRAGLFAIPEKQRAHTSQWKRKFNDHKRAAQCYLLKRDKSEALLDNEVLATAVGEYRTDPDCDPLIAQVFDEYVQADYGWSPASGKMAELEWDIVNSALFERVRAKRQQNLGEETLGLYDGDPKMPDLTDEDRDYLDQLAKSGPKRDPAPEDKSFFRKHYRELQHSPTLFSRWEAFILEKAVENDDFLIGLAECIRLLRPRAGAKSWRIVLRAKAAKDKDLYHVNASAGTYFATRYRGIQGVLGRFIEFKDFRILQFPELLAQWQASSQIRKRLKVSSESRAACQLVFYVELEHDPQRQIKLVWRFNPCSVAANLREDMARLAGATHPAVATTVDRETSGRTPVPLDLSNSDCLQPAYGRSAGSLVPPSERLADCEVRTPLAEILSNLVAAHNLTQDSQQAILAAFESFEKAYSQALTAFLESGLSADKEVLAAADALAQLFRVSSSRTFPDKVLGTVLPALLTIGLVNVKSFGADERRVAIVPPWHPLRLLAILSKAQQFAKLLEKLTAPHATLSDADGNLFFEDTAEWLGHIYYPEVVSQLQGPQPDILSVCHDHMDYSVHEPPIRSPDLGSPADDDPRAAAAQIGATVESYLELQPHERDNLSVVLFECDSELLPGAVVEQIRRLSENEEHDAMCQILLAHSDKTRLRKLYRALVRCAETSDTFNTSEATREFMARLRINIIVSEGAASTSKEGHPYDIVFSEGTIARLATLQWEEIPIISASPAEVKPSAWSRRRPMSSGAISAAVYLAAPAAPVPVWHYHNALAYANQPEKARKVPDGQCLVPCRSLGIHEAKIGRLIDKMHSLGTWVVNFDELLHRKLLENKGIKVIRFKQNKTQGRNLIISSKAKDGLLRTALRRIASQLLPDLDALKLKQLVDDLINEANSISGKLVLRAVRRAENAKELIGLVLSKYLVSRELGTNRHTGWFLLDDYASWLGEKEEQIADILCLSPGRLPDGAPILDVVVTEAKFVEHSSVGKKTKESASQLRQTLARLETGLAENSNSLDRAIWLARISDMIVDGLEVPAVENFDAAAWRKMVRTGACKIRIRGYSHVFDQGPEESASQFEPVRVKETENGFQEVFTVKQARDFLKAFLDKQAPPRQTPAGPDHPAARPPRKPTSPEVPAPSPAVQAKSDQSPSPGEIEEVPGSTTKPALPPASEQHSAVVTVPHAAPLASILAAYPGPQDVEPATLAWLQSTAQAARRALLGYQMPAELTPEGPILTPNSLLLKFKGSDDLTAQALERRRSELYTTHGLKVISIRPEPGAVAVSIERPTRERVSLGSVWKQWQPTRGPLGNTRVLIAIKEEDNSHLFLDPLSQSPHTLIAGTTGSGKSVLMQNLLLGIAATNTPQQSKIILIDPKHGVDYGPLARLPHIDSGIITSTDASLSAINALVQEMERRYPLLQKAGVNHVTAYNSVQQDKLPYIWLIHDEFSDWMQSKDYREHIVALVNRLAMKARAAGIFLIFAAQRPSVDAMPMQLRDNLDNRLILRVANEGTSVFCLGEKGAENLLLKGQIIARLGGTAAVLGQVPFASLEELQRLCQSLQGGPA